jgi:hypothetical protein
MTISLTRPATAPVTDPIHRIRRVGGRLAAALLATCLATLPGRGNNALVGAATLAAPIPQVQLTPGVSFGLIGGSVELSAAIVNAGGPDDLGYGPFIDLVIDKHGADGNNAGEKCDEIELVAGGTRLDGAPPTNIVPYGGGEDALIREP